MLRVTVFAATLLLAGRAVAADAPVYAPEASWVRALPIPKLASATDGSATQVLLDDYQARLTADGDDHYQREVFKILSPQGLGASGRIAQVWDPATETLTIHHLNIIHGDKVIDVLADGQKFMVLRRENNLELAMLDGRLTATIQPEGLEVGDVIDMAYTVTRRDPALGGHSSDISALSHTGVAGRVFIRTLWPNSKPVIWRETPGVDAPKVTRTTEGQELVIDMVNATAPKPPVRAPLRFAQVGTIELSDFHDWAEVSGQLAPLYEKAGTLRPDSALKAEIAKIATASSDPKARAEAALRLVQDRTRYVFLGMNDGGLVPADADETWARRFGDCKGKTVLLVSLLRGLGLDAQPAVVSTQLGDGMDQRLPSTGWFDHVIVRLRIGEKTYWLDGTRLGDRSLDDLQIPNFHWALPIQPHGASLIALSPPPLTAPMYETLVRIDATKGVVALAPTHVEVAYRGDIATAMRQTLLSTPRSDYERSMREMWTKAYPWLTLDKVEVDEDDKTNTVRLTGDGLGKVDWTTGSDGARYYYVRGTGMGEDIAFKREPGPNSDAPYSVSYPNYTKSVQEMALPLDGDFVLVGTDVDAQTAGAEFKRKARIENGTLKVETSYRSLVPEFPAAMGQEASETLRKLPRGEVAVMYQVRKGGAPAAAKAELKTDPEADRKAAEQGDAAAQFRLSAQYAGGKGLPVDRDQAMKWLRRSAEQGYAQAQSVLGGLYLRGEGVEKDPAVAAQWFRKAADQGDPSAQYTLAFQLFGGVGVPENDADALKWLQKAADQSYEPARFNLGERYYFGHGAPKDADRGRALIQAAAEHGLSAAQVQLAWLYHAQVSPLHDDAKALVWMRKAADQGDSNGESGLGVFYRYGSGVPKDINQAIVWFKKAAEHGNADAEYTLYGLYREGDKPDLPKDMAESVKWLRKAAEHGLLDAENSLGYHLASGDGMTVDYAEALVWLNKAADRGDPHAQNTLGFMYQKGEGVPVDLRKAMEWYRKSAAQGHAKAMLNLAGSYWSGEGAPQDYGQALEWYKKAADHGSPVAYRRIGEFYIQGHGGKPDPAQAAIWLRKGVDAGDAVSATLLGGLYANGSLGSKDLKQALSLYESGAALGNPRAGYLAGVAYRDGRGADKNLVRAQFLLQQAATAGDVLAQADLGVMYLSGQGGVRDEVQAAVWLRKAVDQGNASAQMNLGLLYQAGKGVTKDEAEAVSLFTKAADQNLPNAQLVLGEKYYHGVGVPQDMDRGLTLLRKAAEHGLVHAETELGWLYHISPAPIRDDSQALTWTQKATDQGDPFALNNLGVLYQGGFGVPKDQGQALAWFRKAAEKGNVNGELNLGVAYFEGNGVAQDRAEAVTWFRKAAEQGDAVGERDLGIAYERGLGIAADRTQAQAWLTKAAAQGDAAARRELDALAGKN